MFINSILRTDSGISANSEGVVWRRPRLSAGTGPAPRNQGECPQYDRRSRAVAGTRQYKTGRLIQKYIFNLGFQIQPSKTRPVIYKNI